MKVKSEDGAATVKNSENMNAAETSQEMRRKQTQAEIQYCSCQSKWQLCVLFCGRFGSHSESSSKLHGPFYHIFDKSAVVEKIVPKPFEIQNSETETVTEERVEQSVDVQKVVENQC